MLRPKHALQQTGGAHLGNAVGDCLYLDGRTIASPALRVLAWFDSGVADEAVTQGYATILDLFLARYGPDLRSLTRSRHGDLPKARVVTPRLLAAMRAVCARGRIGTMPPMRMGGWIEAPHFIESAPYLRLDSAQGLVALELALPHRAPDLIDMADRLTGIFATMPLRCGVMGFGFFMPAYLESLSFVLPMTTTHLPAAIEITPQGLLSASGFVGRPAGGGAALGCGNAQASPVLADIGWRTLIGAPFMASLPDLSGLEGAAGISVLRQSGLVSITAGARPIWGATMLGEDISAYARVAAALRPLRMSPRLAASRLFGGDDDDPARFDRICAYLERFDLSAPVAVGNRPFGPVKA